MSENKQVWQTWHYMALWIIALISLLLNVLLFAGIIAFRARAQQEVKNVAATLNTINLEDSFEVPISVDQRLAISMTVPFSDTFHVPIIATVPVSTSILFSETIDVPIEEVIRVDTTVNVPFGEASIPIPIVTDIPVNLDVEVPISKQVPVVIDIPVNLEVDVPVRSVVPIDSEVPVVMDFPVTIPLSDLGFNVLLQQVKDALNLLGQALGVETTAP